MFRRVVVLVAAALALAPTAGAGLTSSEASILREMNRVRTAHGLQTLRVDNHLQDAAHSYSVELMRTGMFAHGDFAGRMRRFGVTAGFTGENLAWGTGPYATARGLVAAWLASPHHRENLLSASFRRVGVGAASGTFQGYRGATVATTDFAG